MKDASKDVTAIVQTGHPALHKPAAPVPVSEISSPRIQGIIARMKKALHGEDDGVGIAAPQIGEPLQIFIVAGRVFDQPDAEPVKKKSRDGHEEDKEKAETPTRRPVRNIAAEHVPGKDLVCINPVITKVSKETRMLEEGCLSVRWLYGKVRRSVKASIRAYDENGKVFERGGSGLLAHIFQHETDHLKGILFIEKAHDIVDLPPKKEARKEEQKKEKTKA